MKTLTCSNCKSIHHWDYNKSYEALLESKLPSREVKCLCGTTLTIIRLKTDIPETSVVSQIGRETQERQRQIIEKRLNSPQIWCTNCKDNSGWYQERHHESIPLGHKNNLLCQHCSHTVLIIEGGVPEKYKQMNRPKVDRGYAGVVEDKRNRKTRKRREKVDKTPIIKW